MSSEIVQETFNGATPFLQEFEQAAQRFEPKVEPLIEDDPLLDDPDAEKPSWTRDDKELEISLVAHICRDTPVLKVASELLDPDLLSTPTQRRLVQFVYEYFTMAGEAPKPSFLHHLLRRNLRENKVDKDSEILAEASLILDYTDVASSTFWVKEIYARQRKFMILQAMKAMADGDQDKFWKLSEQAKKIVQEEDELWNPATAVSEPSEQLIDGLISERDLVLLYGPSGSFKSFVSLDWCLSIAMGLPWQGRGTTQQKVLYVCAESGENLKKRVDAWGLANHYTAEMMAEGFRGLTKSLKVDDPVDYQRLLKHVERWRPTVVCFDTVDRCMVGSESSTEDMKKFVNAVIQFREETGVAVLLVHHTGKDITRGSKGDNRLPSACDVVVQCLKSTPEASVTRLLTEKMKEDERPSPVYLRSVRHNLGYLKKNGDEETSLSLTTATEAEYVAKTPDSLTAEERLALNLIPALKSDGITDDLVKLHGINQGELAEQMGIDKRAASKLFANLEKAGLIARRPLGKFKYVWKPDHQSSV